MKVKELIEQLSQFDPELPISFEGEDYSGLRKASKAFLWVDTNHVEITLTVSFDGDYLKLVPPIPVHGCKTKFESEMEHLSFGIEESCRDTLIVQSRLMTSELVKVAAICYKPISEITIK